LYRANGNAVQKLPFYSSTLRNVQVDRCIELVNGPLTFNRGKCAGEHNVSVEPVNGSQTFNRGKCAGGHNVSVKPVNGPLTFNRGKCAGGHNVSVKPVNGPLTFNRGKCAGRQVYRACERPLDVQQREMCRWTDVSSL